MDHQEALNPICPSVNMHRLFTIVFRMVLLLALSGFSAERAIPAESNSATPAESTEPVSPEETVSRIHELGYFHVRQLRPTRNETIDLKFELHILMPEKAQELGLETRLNQWNRRLRDQVITAVRNAETKDFKESDLKKLQRMIRLRINRLLKSIRIEEIYITQFEFALQ
jgi:flagellar basal body-associated protein FliL